MWVVVGTPFLVLVRVVWPKRINDPLFTSTNNQSPITRSFQVNKAYNEDYNNGRIL